MSTVAQVFLGLGIVAAGIALFAVVGEVSLWFSMRAFRDEPTDYRSQVRRRLRRAFYDGVMSIGLWGKPNSNRRTNER